MAHRLSPPVEPMLARLARELPAGDYQYEPKWDGFRCLAFVAGGRIDLRSRHQRPLARYFPELVEGLSALGRDAVLDGELVIARPGGLDFGALLARIHPSSARVERLRREAPAALVAFDLLADGGDDLRGEPLAGRRARLERLLRAARPPLLLTPATRELGVARGWLDRFHGAGIDGVMAKARDGTYQPGRRAQVKVKRERTADCVVGGFRTFAAEPVVASLLLGLWDEAGALRHVGVVSSLPEQARRALFDGLAARAVPLQGHPWARGFSLGGGPAGRLGGAAGRWDPRRMAQDWTAVAPSCVVEVAYGPLDDGRFRHPARLVRFRPDRTGASCTLDQLAPAAPDLPGWTAG